MNSLRKIAIYFAIAVSINWLAGILKSTYPAKFLEDKIVELLITLMAINTATAGIIVSKIDDISKRYNIDFTKSVKEIKKSILMQIWLVGISALILVLFNSSVIEKTLPEYYKSFCDTALLTIFIAAIDILRDTGLAIFAIYEAIGTLNGKDKQKQP